MEFSTILAHAVYISPFILFLLWIFSKN